MTASRFNRRRFLKASAAASAAAAAAPYIQTSHAAGSLSVGFWDHWVPGANAVLTKLCNEWSKKEKVDLKIDYFPDQKLVLTGFTEAQAKSGHDILALPTWFASAQASNLEPVDDIMETLIADNGNVLAAVEYLGKQSGHWIGVPATPSSQMTTPCARIDLFKQHVGLDITKMYPPEALPDKTLTDQWTWDTFLVAAENCFTAGYPFGSGPRTNWRLGRLGQCAVRLVRRGIGGRQGQRDGQLGCDQAGIGIHEAARAIPAARRVHLG